MLEETHNTLVTVLGVANERIRCHPATRLLGEIPELDSMAVVAILTALEDQFGIEIADDEVEAEIFMSLGSLADFVASKLA